MQGDWWNTVMESLSRLTEPVRRWGSGVISDAVVPPGKKGFISPIPTPAPTPPQTPTPMPTPTPTPTPMGTPGQEVFTRGFEGYGSPLATASGQFAQSAAQNPLPDPLLPAIIALMESSGGRNQTFANNPFNWGMQPMPDLNTAIDRIYSGIGGRTPYYEDYLQSGDLSDFFNVYTPPSPANPPLEELINRYNLLRELFGWQQ